MGVTVSACTAVVDVASVKTLVTTAPRSTKLAWLIPAELLKLSRRGLVPLGNWSNIAHSSDLLSLKVMWDVLSG